MNKKELGLGIGAIALGIATLVYFLSIPPKSAFYPRMIIDRDYRCWDW